MIGQEILKKNFTLKGFTILVGPKGSGKKTFISEYCKENDIPITVLDDCKVDTLRNLIKESYFYPTEKVYVIPNADDMSLPAKNSILKVTEEPPNNAKFVMLLEDLNNTLPTIRSRANVYSMDMYTPNHITQYIKVNNYDVSEEEKRILLNVCENPFEVTTMIASGVLDLYNYAVLVVENIAEVSTSNAFKIGSKIAFKDETDKYNLKLFWKVFTSVCMDKLLSDPDKYASAIHLTSKYLQDLRIKGINKQSTFDSWILDIRLEWE